jgi:hypothetical protein
MKASLSFMKWAAAKPDNTRDKDEGCAHEQGNKYVEKEPHGAGHGSQQQADPGEKQGSHQGGKHQERL